MPDRSARPDSGGHINCIAPLGAMHAIGPREPPMPLPMGVLVAIAHVGHKSVGQVGDAAMTDGDALMMVAKFGLLAKGAWQNQRQCNFLDGVAHFYGSYTCADLLHAAVGAVELHFYRQLLEPYGITDPHFKPR